MTPAERASWLEWRRKGLGGSDIGAIFGLSRWSDPWSVWLDKVHGASSGDDDSRITGRLLEEAVAKYAAQRLDADGLMVGPMSAHPERPWMRGSPDYFLRFGARHDLLECKTAEYQTSEDGWGPDMSDEIPPAYRCQVDWYMAVLDRPIAWVAVFFKRSDAWALYRIERNAEREADMIQRAGNWWAYHVQQGNPPNIDASSGARAGLARVFPQPADRGDLRPATPEEEHLVRQYHDTRHAVRDLSKEADRLGNEIRDAIGNNAGLRFRGGRVKWSRGATNTLRVTLRD